MISIINRFKMEMPVTYKFRALLRNQELEKCNCIANPILILLWKQITKYFAE